MKIIRASRPETGFLIVRNETVRDPRLSYRATGVLLDILSRPDDWSTSAERMIRENGKEKRDAILSAFAELREAGYMRTVKSRDSAGHWRTDTYVFDQPEADQPKSDDPTPAPTRGDDVSPLVTPETAQPTSVEPTLLGSTEDEVPEELGSDPVEALFEEFWTTYPRSRRAGSKALNLTKFRTAVKNGANPQVIVDAIKARVAWWEQENTPEGYRKTSLPWLNQGCWEEEVVGLRAKVSTREAYAFTEGIVREPTW